MAALLVDVVRALTVLNLLLLLGLAAVWGRNWLELRSKHALGLLLFAGFLIGEHALGAYLFMMDPTVSAWIADAKAVPPPAQYAMTAFRALEFVGLLFLSWVTYD